MNRTLKSLMTWSVAVGCFVAAKGVVYGVLAASSLSPAERVDALLAQNPVAASYQAMRRHFPMDALELHGHMVDAYRHGTPGESARASLAVLSGQIHARLAGNLRAASDAQIGAIMDDWLITIAPFAEDTAACSAIAARGLTAVAANDPRIDPEHMAEAAERLYATMGTYAYVPDRRYATEGDFTAFAEYFNAHGGTVEALDTITLSDPEDPQLCGAYRAFLTSLRDADSQGADRLRMEMVVALFGG